MGLLEVVEVGTSGLESRECESRRREIWVADRGVGSRSETGERGSGIGTHASELGRWPLGVREGSS